MSSRIESEIQFATEFSELFPTLKEEWLDFIEKAKADPENAEKILAPIGVEAKKYTIHCCGHAHIDMNWTWPWLETIATSHDTFATIDRLMDEFPGLTYTQSQISVYKDMAERCPEVFQKMKKRISEGSWQVTASSWVEGDKNMASGESLCRHILYSKRWLAQHIGLPYDAVKIDWMPDTFGHPWTLPSILTRGGVGRYYRCRPEIGPWLEQWQSPDGSRVLAFRDKGWYNAEIIADKLTKHFIDYTKENGLKDFLWVYGVGDHGGGPTREQARNILELDSWLVFPNVVFSTIDRYFESIEPNAGNLPVHDGDYNTVFEGCYTSQSKVKLVNRLAETILPEAETISILANRLIGFEYRSGDLRTAWEDALFNQFHDILAGSSGHAAMEEAGIRFQRAEGLSGTIKMRALRAITDKIDTSSLRTSGETLQRPFLGSGDVRTPGRMPTLTSGLADIEPIVVFNPLPYPRTETVQVKIWNRDWEKVEISDNNSSSLPAQEVGKSVYITDKGLNIIFPAADVPAMGYKVYSARKAASETEYNGVSSPSSGIMENEFLRVEIDGPSGAIKHLIYKSTGFDYVPDGGLLGVLELYQEEPHNMTAWEIGKIKSKKTITEGGVPIADGNTFDNRDTGDSLGMVYSIRSEEHGPHRMAVRTLHMINQSRVRLEISLSAGSPSVEIGVSTDWREIGSQEDGVPMLKLALPLSLNSPKFTTEIPFGSMERPTDGSEIPALRWVDLSDDKTGLTLVNDCKNGFSAEGNTLRATLIRSTYDPDPFPEMGRHDIKFSLIPHTDACDVATATKTAESFNQPMSVIGTGIHAGTLPMETSFIETLTPNISIASIKKAEDSDAVIIRLYETSGIETEAKIRLSGILGPDSKAVETDLLEQPLTASSARIEGDTLIVKISSHGISTVRIYQ